MPKAPPRAKPRRRKLPYIMDGRHRTSEIERAVQRVLITAKVVNQAIDEATAAATKH